MLVTARVACWCHARSRVACVRRCGCSSRCPVPRSAVAGGQAVFFLVGRRLSVGAAGAPPLPRGARAAAAAAAAGAPRRRRLSRPPLRAVPVAGARPGGRRQPPPLVRRDGRRGAVCRRPVGVAAGRCGGAHRCRWWWPCCTRTSYCVCEFCRIDVAPAFRQSVGPRWLHDQSPRAQALPPPFLHFLIFFGRGRAWLRSI